MDKKYETRLNSLQAFTGAYPRSMFKSAGYRRDELKKPVIGVVSSWSEMHPGSYPNKELAQFVKAGIWAAGGTPVEFHTIALCDAVAQGCGMHYVLQAASSRRRRRSNLWSGRAVSTACPPPSCDKSPGGMLMAAARLKHPDHPPSPGTDALPFSKTVSNGSCATSRRRWGVQGQEDQ